MCLRQVLIIGAVGSLLAACGWPFGPTGAETRVRGWVLDTLSRPVPGARIDILDGPLAGRSTNADGRGAFQLDGNVNGAVSLRASRDGFEAKTIAIVWQPPDSREQTITFFMKTLEPALSITPGSYTLTVTSDLSTATAYNGVACAGFPADLLSRTYQASISVWSPPPDAYDFLVDFASPTMTKPPGVTCRGRTTPVVRGCFAFSVAGSFVGFEIQNSWGWDWIEELPGFRYLMIEGTAPTSEPATATETSITIPFSGTFDYCQLKSGLNGSSCHQVPAEQIVEYRSCSSQHDTMVFTKH
jgi:Carboxypeptidase regulatory-like domain